jgi:hypothetical protein
MISFKFNTEAGITAGCALTQALRAGHSTARVVGDSATYDGRAAPQPRERVKEDLTISVDRS